MRSGRYVVSLKAFAGTGLLYANLTYARLDTVDYGH